MFYSISQLEMNLHNLDEQCILKVIEAHSYCPQHNNCFFLSSDICKQLGFFVVFVRHLKSEVAVKIHSRLYVSLSTCLNCEILVKDTLKIVFFGALGKSFTSNVNKPLRKFQL